MTELTLLSTVVAPRFAAGSLTLTPVAPEQLRELLGHVSANLCGHPVTDRVLREVYPGLPLPQRGFWDGSTVGLAIRPKSGVRSAAQAGDTQVALDDLEAVCVEWTAL